MFSRPTTVAQAVNRPTPTRGCQTIPNSIALHERACVAPAMSSQYGRAVYIVLFSRREHHHNSRWRCRTNQFDALPFLLSPLLLRTLGSFETSSSCKWRAVDLGDSEGRDCAPSAGVAQKEPANDFSIVADLQKAHLPIDGSGLRMACSMYIKVKGKQKNKHVFERESIRRVEILWCLYGV